MLTLSGFNVGGHRKFIREAPVYSSQSRQAWIKPVVLETPTKTRPSGA